MPVGAGAPIPADELDPPVYGGRQTVAQSTSNGVWTSITMTTEDSDSHGGHSTSVTTARYVFQRAGVYLVLGAVPYVAGGGTIRAARLLVNGAVLHGSQLSIPIAVGGVTIGMCVPRFVVVTAPGSDWTELQGWQDAGTISTYVGVPEAAATLSIVRIRTA